MRQALNGRVSGAVLEAALSCGTVGVRRCRIHYLPVELRHLGAGAYPNAFLPRQLAKQLYDGKQKLVERIAPQFAAHRKVNWMAQQRENPRFTYGLFDTPLPDFKTKPGSPFQRQSTA